MSVVTAPARGIPITGELEGARGVAARRVTALIPGLEPLLALRRCAMRERVRRHATLRLLLDAVVADGRRRVERVRDLGLRRGDEIARVGGVLGPHAGVAVGLQLGAYGLALGAGARGVRERAEEILHVVPVLVRDDVALRERSGVGAELRAHVREERDVEVDLAVVRAVEG